MSGFEAAGIVFGIVSVFTGATKLLVEWKAKRRERNEKRGNADLLDPLTMCGNQVQNEYDQDFARLGHVFAVGDGKSEDTAPCSHC